MDFSQHPCQWNLVEVFPNRLADLGLVDVVDICHHIFDRAVLLEQYRRCLLADAGDIRDVIRAVALECPVVDELYGGKAVALNDFVVVINDCFGHAFDGDHD